MNLPNETDLLTAGKPLSGEPSFRPRTRTEEIVHKKYLLIRPALLFLCAGAAMSAIYAGRLAADARAESLPAPPVTMWLLFALSAVLLSAALWPVPKLFAAMPARTPRELLRRAFRERVFLLLIGVALLCLLAEVPLFFRLNAAEADAPPDHPLVNTGSWLIYLISLLAWLAAFAWRARTAPDAVTEGSDLNPNAHPERLPRRVEWVVLAALFALAALLRFVYLGSAPPGFWFDEAQNGLVARGLVTPGALRPVFVGDYTLMGSFYFYLLGFLIKLAGSSIWVVRLIPALSGSLVVVLLYALASRLYGWRVGVTAAFLLSVSAWHLTFSRMGLVTMFTVALDVAVYVCLERALRTGKLIYYAVGGLLLGVAFHTYYVARLVPLVIVALLLHRAVSEGPRLLRALRAGVIVFACGVVLGAAPLLLFIGQKPEVFNQRLKDASIFSAEGGGGDSTPVRTSLVKHLLMFNYQGDWNGRHNVPDEPHLDPVMAALFFVGLGLCVLRAWRWQYFFPLVWFAAALSGGVLSLLFEAPQAHRTVENSVVTALFAGIVLGEIWGLLQYVATGPALRRATQKLSPYVRDAHYLPPMVVVFALAAILLSSAALNLRRYFEAHATHPTVWSEMGAAETQVAWTLAKLTAAAPDARPEVYVSDKYHQINLSEFLAPGVAHRKWEGFDLVPLETANERGAILLLEPKSTADLALIARLYPRAVFEVLRAPSDPAPLLYRISIPPDDMRSLRGVRVSFSRAAGDAFAPEDESRVDEVTPRFASELKTNEGETRSVRLASTIKVGDFDDYEFRVERPAGVTEVRVAVDGAAVEENQAVSLAKGLHLITVTARVEGARAAGTVQLRWKSKKTDEFGSPDPARLYDPRRVAPRGLTGAYRAGTGGEGEPLLKRIDPIVSFLYHHTPLERPYNVEWAGRLYIPRDGIYSFGTEQRSRSKLLIDGAEVLDNRVEAELKETRLKLAAGFHDIRLLFVDAGDFSHVFLYWTPPGRKRSIIPSAFLWPSAALTEGAFGRANLPTIEESDGSVIPADRLRSLRAGAE